MQYLGGHGLITVFAASTPIFENVWLVAASIPLLFILLAVGLMLAGPALALAVGWAWKVLLSPAFERPVRLGIILGLCLIVGAIYLTSLSVGGGHQAEYHAEPVAQDLLQQRLSQDEEALDRGVLTYPEPPTLKTDRPFMLSVTITDTGKHPRGTMSAARYSSDTRLVVYPNNVPTGGIVGVKMTCGRLAIVGTGNSQSWTWNLTPLRSGQQFATITVDTYDGTGNTILSQEIIVVGLQVEEGPWYASIDDWWGSVRNFATTTAGVIVTIGAAVTTIAGGVAWVQRRRAGKAKASAKKGAPKHRRQHEAEDQANSPAGVKRGSTPEVEGTTGGTGGPAA
jgi:hypothetical protein